MNDPLKRHSERVNYIHHVMSLATSVQGFEPARKLIWNDLQQISNPVVRRGAVDLFRLTMNVAEELEKKSPEEVGPAMKSGLQKLVEYLEANDVDNSSG